MSGIYIPGMEIPTSCSECAFVTQYYDGGCDVCCLLDTYASKHGTLDDCPLIPVPDHGRLIDADALVLPTNLNDWNSVVEYVHNITDCWKAIDNAPTIIEAEGVDG